MEAVLSWQQGQKTLDAAVTGLGRALDNAIVVSDSKVSSHHAEIRREGQEYVLIDLQSKNGTFVNGVQLQPALPRLLSDRDLIRLGDTTYTFTLNDVAEFDPTVYSAPPQYAPTIMASPVDLARSGGLPPAPGVPAAYNSVPGTPAYGNGGIPQSYPPGSPLQQIPPIPGGQQAYQPSSPLQQIPPIPGGQQPYQANSPLQQIPPIPGGQQSYQPGSPLQQIPSIPVYTPPAQTQQKKGGALKWVLGIVGGLVVLLVVACVVVGYIGSRPSAQTGTTGTGSSKPTAAATPVPAGPAGALTTYCNALKSQDYQTAYNQLNGATKNKYTENDFSLFFTSNNGAGKVTACTVGATTTANNQATGSIAFTYADGTTNSPHYVLVQNGNNWEITNVHASSPNETLAAYCAAIARHDYRGARNQLSSQAKAAVSESQIANQMQSVGVTGCTATKAQENATAANSVVTYSTALGATQMYATTLINENGTWKILNQKQQ